MWQNPADMMKNTTLIRLITGAAIGLVIGLLYGWVIRPVEYVDTTPNTLRADYRTEYVLMVAEAYSSDGDLDAAIIRLATLSSQPPIETVLDAIDYSIEIDRPRSELDVLNYLANQLRNLQTSPEIGAP